MIVIYENKSSTEFIVASASYYFLGLFLFEVYVCSGFLFLATFLKYISLRLNKYATGQCYLLLS